MQKTTMARRLTDALTKRSWTACVLTVAARGSTPHGSFVLPHAKGIPPISAM